MIGGGARAWPAYPALSAPLTMMGVERRWFLLSATLGMAMWNAINSILIGAACFCLLYGVGWWAWRTDPHMLTILRESVRFKTRYDPAKWAESPWYILITQARRQSRPIMTTTDLEVADHHAAGALADELPYWGWLPDDRTCLTRRGELLTLARLSPTVVDGHTPEQLDAVLSRWQRMLSGIDSRTRLYFYLLAPAGDLPRRGHRPLGRRRPRATQAARVPCVAHPTDRDLCGVVLRPETLDGRSRPAQRAVVEELHTDVDDAAAESQRGDLLPRADRRRGGALSAAG